MAKAYVNKRDKFLWDNSFKPEMSIPIPEVSDVGKAVVVDADGDYTLGNVSVEDEIVYFKIDAQGENLIDCTMSQIKAALDDSKTVCLIRINGTTKFILPLFVYVPLTGSVNYAEFTNCKPGTYISRRRVNYETVKLDFANNTITYTDESGYISQDYTTGEIAIGKWIDGSDLYEKTIVYDTVINANSTTAIAIDIANLNLITNISGIALNNANNSIPINCRWPQGGYNWGIAAFQSSSGISLITGGDMTLIKVYITIRYTKTTD